MLVITDQKARLHNEEHLRFNFHRHENLESHLCIFMSFNFSDKVLCVEFLCRLPYFSEMMEEERSNRRLVEK
jgi:hypothetical protein